MLKDLIFTLQDEKYVSEPVQLPSDAGLHLEFEPVQSVANALSSTSRQKTHGYPLMQQAGFISTVCGSPVP